MSYDPQKLATMAAQLRSGARRPDPNLISVSRLREVGDRSAALSRALRSTMGERPLDSVTASETEEIERIAREYAGQHGLPAATDDTTTPQTATEREVARIVGEHL